MQPARRLGLFSAAIAVIAAVLAVLLPATLASAQAGSAAGTRVGASHPAVILTVRVPGPVSAGEGRGEAVSQCQFVVGACVAAEDTGSDLADAATCGGMSFSAGTRVLLASGAAIPISQLKPGDKVLATNTKTGKTSPQTVTAVLLHHDTDLYDLTVKTARGNAVIDTTRNHPFWDVTRDRWVKARALKYGDLLRTSNGVTATVAGGYSPAVTTGWMWDLSVPGGNDHDFYIDTAVATVLVHNCDISNPESFEGASRADAEQELENSGWYDAGPTREGGGVRWRLPDNPADQVRIMPGNPADPNIIKQGPYIRFSINSAKYGPFSLADF